MVQKLEIEMRKLKPLRAVLSSVVLVGIAVLTVPVAYAQQVLKASAFPAVDDIVRATIPAWKNEYPNAEIKVVGRQFSDHRRALRWEPWG